MSNSSTELSAFDELSNENARLRKIISQYEVDAELILSPVLGYPLFEPGSPGYSDQHLSYNVGDHVAQSLMMAAATKINELKDSDINKHSIHTYPIYDSIEHTITGFTCECKPVVEAILRVDGTYGFHIIHNSQDGRK